MDSLFGLDRVSPHDDSLALLTTVYDSSLLMILESILKDAEIPYLKKERGCGGVVRILTGYQSFGTDLYVRPEDEERANDVLSPLFEEADAEATEENGEV